MSAIVTAGRVEVLLRYPVRRVLWLADNGNNANLRAMTRLFWRKRGWLVEERSGDNDMLTNPYYQYFDLAVGWVIEAARGNEFREMCEMHGIPYVLGIYGTGASATADADLTGNTVFAIPGNGTQVVRVIDNSHPITNHLPLGEQTFYGNAFDIYSGLGYVSDGQTVGTVLIEGTSHNGVDGYPCLMAVPEGTEDLQGTPTTVRGVVGGLGSYDQSLVTDAAYETLEKAMLWALGDLITPPALPTLTATVTGQTSVDLDGSAFVAGAGGSHIASELQVTTDADTGYATPVYAPGQTAGGVTSWSINQLLGGTDYRARVRYLEDQPEGEVWSNWSVDETFTTWAAPDAPTVSVVSTAPDKAEFATSAFSSSDGDRTHDATEWELALSTDPTFSAPLASVLVQQGDLLTYAFLGLDLWRNQYIARARHRDDNGGWSAWGVSTATGLVSDGQFYTAFAERPIGTDIKDDVPADWDEMVDGDESDWPIEYRSDATCEVVVHRSSLDGVYATADPIWWQKFPQVDKQIVWTRLMFEEQGGTNYPCGTGVQSASGLICRTNYGLLQTADFENDIFSGAEGYGIGTVGENGELGIRHFGDPGPGWTGNPPGINTRAISQVGRTIWDTAGDRTVGQFAQVRARTMLTAPGWTEIGDQTYVYLAAWPELVISEVMGRTVRYCTLYLNWYRQQVTGADTGGSQQFACARGSWYYLKVGSKDVLPQPSTWYSYAFGSRQGFEGSRIEGSYPGGTGRTAVQTNRCEQYDPGWQITDYYDWRICSGNEVRFIGLKPGWRIQIGTDSHTDRPYINGSTDGSDVYFDFSTQAWPADWLRLYNAGGTLVDEWYVPTGIWGGDEYTINAGGLGVGPIGGAAVRLGP